MQVTPISRWPGQQPGIGNNIQPLTVLDHAQGLLNEIVIFDWRSSNVELATLGINEAMPARAQMYV